MRGVPARASFLFNGDARVPTRYPVHSLRHLRTTNAAIDGVEWWDTAHGLMVKHGMPPRQLIPRLVREAKMIPRPGALELLKKLELLEVRLRSSSPQWPDSTRRRPPTRLCGRLSHACGRGARRPSDGRCL